MSAISTGLGALIGNLVSGAPAGPSPVTGDDLATPLYDIQQALTILKDTMDSADRNSREAVTAATDAATQIEEMGSDVKDITEHTYTVVIPHSMSWLAGYVVSHWIDPLRADVAALKQAVAKLVQWEAEIREWRAKFVDPNLALWIGWRKWFLGWPQGVLFKWHDWFQHPAEFGQWAAPPITGPLVSYLAAKTHREARDNLALVMLAAWSEEPTRVLDAIETWLNS